MHLIVSSLFLRKVQKPLCDVNSKGGVNEKAGERHKAGEDQVALACPVRTRPDPLEGGGRVLGSEPVSDDGPSPLGHLALGGAP